MIRDPTSIVVALITGTVTLAVAGWSYVGSRRAQREAAAATTEQTRLKLEADRVAVESHAYERARQSYQLLLGDLERQVERYQLISERTRDQVDQVTEKLRQEQERSSELRRQLSAVRTKMEENAAAAAATISRLREDLRRAGVDVPHQGPATRPGDTNEH
jgi:predicted RNase H-like nuclease (RuvC/YqgF family)